MNPRLDLLQPYPFEKLKALFAGIEPNGALRPISFGIGEPKHPTPRFIRDALAESLGGLANYPTTAGSEALRQCIAGWLERRYGLPRVDPASQVLPVTGSREALFAFAQTVVDGTRPGALVLCPNPFYQIYEGAALLAGATPVFANSDPSRNFAPAFDRIADDVWPRVQLVYVCSPGNPTGAVLSLEDWRQLFALSDRHGFVIASDECYSEIYFDEGKAPLGALEAAHRLGRGFERLVMFSSLSKRSNVPGLRSGFVAGDAALLGRFLLYRTYHGGAMNPAVQSASVAAWNDEAHVRENRAAYVAKFAEVTPMLAEVLDVALPDAGFYLWADVSRTGLSDTEFAARLYAEQHLTVLPGSYLARETDGINPGANRVRMALVATPEECREGAERIVAFCRGLTRRG
ncbi:succinyldiaminopimelate transaminase [Cupriavidus gilardii]|uniref:Succinyldiaminopimelate transaminase n=1 Tax=Cupriavidus gilardii TaxID=82541 RepID=A0A849BIV6_9BURK|nr:succinyldiaminopimelate transaminase [Cupriavidus gilardii]KAB0594409.1 succinyldiaminopimelate transaminase [Cupriavidus gilardii]MCT9016284.1 succinyldiaminopimelate transaminase [Cupriavidus gilardii]MCT9056054.1 succinyldiaminopimelate transaminase [Cupriavidus gilardii]MCT9118362.1 succinyldiaminopimelate transaminase [Cupriavidus gilardii]NNH13693.1 succinyldiaminopimelate transaminase [Cupriavidus gilardii]